MKQNKLLKIIFYCIIFSVLGLAVLFYKQVMLHFILSLIFVVFANPIVNSIEQLGIKRTFAVLIFFLIFFFGIYYLGSILVPLLTKQIKNFAQDYVDFISQDSLDVFQLPFLANVQAIIERLQNLFPFINFNNIFETLLAKSYELIDTIPNKIFGFSSNVVKVFSYLFTVPIISFFILKDKVFIKKKIYSIIPNKYFEISVIIIDKIKGTIGIYIRALFIECSIVGILATIVLTSLGVKFGVLIGVFAGITNVIPYLGPAMGILLGGLAVILTGGSASLLFWTVFGMSCVQALDNAFVYPLVMGKNTNIHPVIVLLSIVAGGIAYGLIGMLLAVPLVFLVSVVLILLYKSLKQFEFI